MSDELKKKIESGKILFGIRQTLRNHSKIDKAFVSADCRKEIIEMLEEKKVKMEKIDISKIELKNKIGLDFVCEVFGVRK